MGEGPIIYGRMPPVRGRHTSRRYTPAPCTHLGFNAGYPSAMLVLIARSVVKQLSARWLPRWKDETG